MTALVGNTWGSYFTASTAAYFTFDAITDGVAMRFQMQDATPIAKVELFISITGAPGNLEVALVANSVGHPNGYTDIGGGSPTLVSTAYTALTHFTINTITFTNAYTPSTGDYIWVVVYPNSGGTFDGSNKYLIRYINPVTTTLCGVNRSATTTDTGSTWLENMNGLVTASLLDSSDNILPTISAVVTDNSIGVKDFNNTDTPDEYGMAFALPANCTIKVHGVSMYFRPGASTRDYVITVYENDTQKATITPNSSAIDDQYTSNRSYVLYFDSPVEISGAATVRTTLKSSSSSDVRIGWTSWASQASRESAMSVRDKWGCTQTASGGFSEVYDELYAIDPIFELIGTAGGGGVSIPNTRRNTMIGR